MSWDTLTQYLFYSFWLNSGQYISLHIQLSVVSLFRTTLYYFVHTSYYFVHTLYYFVLLRFSLWITSYWCILDHINVNITQLKVSSWKVYLNWMMPIRMEHNPSEKTQFACQCNVNLHVKRTNLNRICDAFEYTLMLSQILCF